MANVTVKETEYGGWGRCLTISNGEVELVASLDFGPRILRYGFAGGRNHFMEDPEGRIVNGGDHFAPVGGGAWKIYGGHRLWTSPEVEPRTTYPDNEPVAWRPIENGAILTPPQERWNQVQKEIEIRLSPEGTEANVVHSVTNEGPWAIEFAVWALSVMAPGGTAIVPLTTRETGLLPNRVLALWPYSDMSDPRVTWGRKYVRLRQDNGPTPFKLGTSNEDGWAAYANGGELFLKRYTHVPDGTYPDYGVSFESYVCDHFVELETLGELRRVAPGETAVHEEVWQLAADFPDAASLEDEAAVERALEAALRE